MVEYLLHRRGAQHFALCAPARARVVVVKRTRQTKRLHPGIAAKRGGYGRDVAWAAQALPFSQGTLPHWYRADGIGVWCLGWLERYLRIRIVRRYRSERGGLYFAEG